MQKPIAERIKELSSQGMRQVDIAEKLGCTQANVSYHLRKQPPRPHPRPHPQQKRRLSIDEIKAMRAAGLTYRAIAEASGVNHQRVHAILKKNGLS